MERKPFHRYFFLGAFAFLIFQMLRILSPFFVAILGAIVLVILFHPVHRAIRSAIGPKWPSLVAGLSTAAIVLLVVLPAIGFIWLLVTEASTLLPRLNASGLELAGFMKGQKALSLPWLDQLLDRFDSLEKAFGFDTRAIVVDAFKRGVEVVAHSGQKLLRNSLMLLINLAMMVFTLFFALRDGPKWVERLKVLIPMKDTDKDHIFEQFGVTITAVIRGLFFTAAAQGVAAMLGFLIAGTPAPFLLGFLTGALSLVPFVGAPSVWLSIGLYYLLNNVVWKGVFVLIWGFLVVSMVDNVVRPIVMGTHMKLPFLFLFFALLGGMKVYGPVGILMGPLVVGLVMAFVRIYRKEFLFPEPPPSPDR